MLERLPLGLIKDKVTTVLKNLVVTFKTVQKPGTELKEALESQKTMLVGHVQHFAEVLYKLRNVELMLAEVRDASKTAVDRIKTLSEKVNEISKQQNQLLAEINGNTKMVAGTVVAIKTLAQTLLDTVTRMETAFKELQLPCVETSTLVRDVLEIWQQR